MEKTKRSKSDIATTVLWVLALACMVAGGVMVIVGSRPLREYITALLGAAFNGGGLPDTPTLHDFGVAIGGIVVLLAGIAFVYAANIVKKNARRAQAEEAKNAQMLMQLNQGYVKDEAPAEEAPADETRYAHFCFRCGKPIEKKEYNYCPYCGTTVARLDREMADLAQPIDTKDIEVTDEPMWGRMPVEEGQNAPKAPRKCLYCGNELKDGEEACPICGHKMRYE